MPCREQEPEDQHSYSSRLESYHCHLEEFRHQFLNSRNPLISFQPRRTRSHEEEFIQPFVVSSCFFVPFVV
jgi:hypothetical protein